MSQENRGGHLAKEEQGNTCGGVFSSGGSMTHYFEKNTENIPDAVEDNTIIQKRKERYKSEKRQLFKMSEMVPNFQSANFQKVYPFL